MGFQLKHGKTLHVSYYNVSRHSTTLSRRQSKTEVSHNGADEGKESVILKEFLKERKQNPRTFMFPIYNHHPPLPQFYFNIKFHILFCFQVTFQEKVFFFFIFLSNISQFLKIAQHLNHKPLPTRSQFSSYWLWFIDERNSQLC